MKTLLIFILLAGVCWASTTYSIDWDRNIITFADTQIDWDSFEGAADTYEVHVNMNDTTAATFTRVWQLGVYEQPQDGDCFKYQGGVLEKIECPGEKRTIIVPDGDRIFSLLLRSRYFTDWVVKDGKMVWIDSRSYKEVDMDAILKDAEKDPGILMLPGSEVKVPVKPLKTQWEHNIELDVDYPHYLQEPITHTLTLGGKEIGFRSDGVVVWREYNPSPTK